MKNLSRMAIMAICCLLTAIFTSACGYSMKLYSKRKIQKIKEILTSENEN